MNRDMTYTTAISCVLYGVVWALAYLYIAGPKHDLYNPDIYFVYHHAFIWAVGLSAFFGVIHLAMLHDQGRPRA